MSAAADSFGRTLLAALAGSAFGWLAVLLAAAIQGLAVMFLAWPFYTVLLVVLGIVVALFMAVLARLWRRLSLVAVMSASAILTFGFFAALMLRIIAANSGRA
ncbi:MAG TPA: hypothetical protein VGM87_26075 [Roseomonas sp.]|jgi:hypothetical protein